MAYIIYNDENGKENIPIDNNAEVKIGRSDKNNIIIYEDSSVSREHCILYFDFKNTCFFIKDLDSRNGTFVNSVILRDAELALSDCDRIFVGSTEFIFCNALPSPDNTTTSTSISKVTFPELARPEMEKNMQKLAQTSVLSKYPDDNKSLKDIPLGSDINGYEIIRVIGNGRFSTVYLAYQKSVERTVALKVFFMDRENAVARNSFMEEIQKIGKLQHPNIISHFDGGLLDNFCYLTMTYIPEGNFKDKIAKTFPMEEKDAIAIIKKIADALEYAFNDHGIIHFDLRPSNILFTDSNEPVITDVGLSSWLAKYYQINRRVILGNPAYMSPEQALDLAVDWTACMYSLGIIFYEALVGRPPFSADSAYKLVQKHKIEDVVFPKNIVISENVKNIILKMTAKKSSDRYCSWEYLTKSLKNALTGKSHPVSTANSGKKIKTPVNLLKSNLVHDRLKLPDRLKYEKLAMLSKTTFKKTDYLDK